MELQNLIGNIIKNNKTELFADPIAFLDTVRKECRSEQDAISSLYSSLLYSYLEDEEMKVWHYSIPMLYELYLQGEETGYIQFPDI